MWRWRVLLAVLILLLVLGQPVLTRARPCLIVMGRSMTLTAGQRLEGDLVVFGGDVRLDAGSVVAGDVLALGGSLIIAGQVERRALAPSGDVRLGETAVVGGDILAGGYAQRAPGAAVQGDLLDRSHVEGGRSPLSHWRERCAISLPGLWFGWPWGVGLAGNILVWALQVLLGGLATVALGILVVLFIPRPVETAGRAGAHYPLRSFGIGLLAWLVALLAVPLLTFSVIGIPPAVLAALAVAAALLLAWVAAGLVVGERTLLALAPVRRRPVLAVAVGLLTLAALLSVPCLGFLIVALVAVWGLGAVVLTRFGTRPYEARPPRVTR